MRDATYTLPPLPASVSAARRHVEAVLEQWGLTSLAWTCTQLISELATNAVIHARTEFTVELSRHGDVLRVCVRDGSAAAAGVRRYGEDSTTGRGLRLVESMTTAWGVQTRAVGKIVWFELDVSQRHTAASWDDGADVDLDALLEQFKDPDGDVPTVQSRTATTLRGLRWAA